MEMISLEAMAPAACVCFEPETYGGCCCGDMECALRAYAERWPMVAMHPVQREWCLDEIARTGGYDRLEWLGSSDQVLAHGVLMAWADYARDKGLL